MAGCSSLTTTQPLGKPASALDTRKLAGIWLTPENEPMFVHHVVDNRLRVAGVDWDDDEPQLRKMEVLVTTDDDRMYFNVLPPQPEEESDAPDEYTIYRVTPSEGDMLVLRILNIETFAKAVENGQLSGTVDRNENNVHVKLTPKESELDDFVSPDKAAEQFILDGAIVLRRLK
ncbi:hypothetical protein [Aeoliella mucimassa]|nr:hypothetical protein [Aeoliella mucimassa]